MSDYNQEPLKPRRPDNVSPKIQWKITVITSIITTMIVNGLILMYNYSSREILYTKYPSLPTPTPSATPKLSSKSNDWAEIISNELEKLPESQIVFNPPTQMRQGKKERIEARISYNDIGDTLIKGLKGRGVPIKQSIKVGPIMKVVLEADKDEFQIAKFSNDEQTVSGRSFAQWEWDVMPIKSGSNDLHLTATISVRIPELGDKYFDLPVIDRTIKVDVDTLFASKKFFETNWQWLSATLLLPFVIWAYKSLSSKKTPDSGGTGTKDPEKWVT
jgi:hypothetical protein